MSSRTFKTTAARGFNRRFPPHVIHSPIVMDIKYNSYYIAGCTENNVYLANVTAPTHLLVTNYSLTDSQSLKINYTGNDTIAWSAIHVSVDSPYIYASEHISPFLFKGLLSDLHVTGSKLKSRAAYFCYPVSPSSAILKVYDFKLQKNVLLKEGIGSGHIEENAEILKSQIDGVFSTDGILTEDPVSHALLYVYYYRNQYFMLDTNLSATHTFRTIDTNSIAKINIAKISSEKKVTYSAPPLFVNGMATAYDNKLYINSQIISNIEDQKAFDDATVMDVYSLKEGNYLYSFYLPKTFMGKKLKYLKVFNNNIVAIFDHYLFVYKINLSKLPKEVNKYY